MPKYQRGDIVLVEFPFSDGIGSKHRPAVVIREEYADEYLICQITKKNRSDKLRGFWILMDSEDGREMGIKTDSFVNADNTICLEILMFHKTIGRFPYIDELEDMIDNI